MVSKVRITTPPDCTYSVQPKRYQCYLLECGIAEHISVIVEYTWLWIVLADDAGVVCCLDVGDGMSGSGKRAGAVSDRPAQLQQPGQIFFISLQYRLLWSIGEQATSQYVRGTVYEWFCLYGEQATSLGMVVCGCLGRTGMASKLIAGTYDVL